MNGCHGAARGIRRDKAHRALHSLSDAGSNLTVTLDVLRDLFVQQGVMLRSAVVAVGCIPLGSLFYQVWSVPTPAHGVGVRSLGLLVVRHVVRHGLRIQAWRLS